MTVLNIALSCRSFAEHAPLWHVRQPARNQTVRADFDAESVLFGTFSAPFSPKTLSESAHSDDCPRSSVDWAGAGALAESLGQRDQPVRRNAPEGAFCPKERYSRRPATQNIRIPKWFWAKGPRLGSDATGPSRHWMSNAAYTSGKRRPGRNRKRRLVEGTALLATWRSCRCARRPRSWTTRSSHLPCCRGC